MIALLLHSVVSTSDALYKRVWTFCPRWSRDNISHFE